MRIKKRCDCHLEDMIPERIDNGKYSYQCLVCEGGVSKSLNDKYNQYYGYSGYDEYDDDYGGFIDYELKY